MPMVRQPQMTRRMSGSGSMTTTKPTYYCFKCGRKATAFIETRVNGGAAKRFTFFHIDGEFMETECTVEVERAPQLEISPDNDHFWSAKPDFED